MMIHTFQSKECFDVLVSGREYFCDGRKLVFGKDFRPAYTYIIEKMKERGIKTRYPIWGWIKHNKYKKPRKFQDYVCLKLDVPDKLVLQSDFDMWHCVLNDFPILDLNEEYDQYDKFSKSKQKEIKIKSWENIFNIKKSKYVQACFPSIKLEYVKSWKICSTLE